MRAKDRPEALSRRYRYLTALAGLLALLCERVEALPLPARTYGPE